MPVKIYTLENDYAPETHPGLFAVDSTMSTASIPAEASCATTSPA
jgi:hypothetical protein